MWCKKQSGDVISLSRSQNIICAPCISGVHHSSSSSAFPSYISGLHYSSSSPAFHSYISGLHHSSSSPAFHSYISGLHHSSSSSAFPSYISGLHHSSSSSVFPSYISGVHHSSSSSAFPSYISGLHHSSSSSAFPSYISGLHYSSSSSPSSSFPRYISGVHHSSFSSAFPSYISGLHHSSSSMFPSYICGLHHCSSSAFPSYISGVQNSSSSAFPSYMSGVHHSSFSAFPSYISGVHHSSSSSSELPSYISGVSHFGWDFCACARFCLFVFVFYFLSNYWGSHIPSSWIVFAGCEFVDGIHPSKTWVSGPLESVRWNACVHRLDLGLYSHPKEFGGNGVRTHVNSKGKIPSTGKKILRVCLFVGCLTSQQHTSVSRGRICSDNFTCCHTEIEVADPTFYLTQSQYTDTGLTSPSTDPITPGAWQGSHCSANV